MSLNYRKYKIKSGDSLEKIAKRFNLTIEGIQVFHNRFCELEDLIGGAKIPKHVKEVFIPMELTSSQPSQDLESSSPSIDNFLRRGSVKINKTYGVIQKTFENGSQKSQIHYKVKIENNIKEDLPYNQLYIRKYQTFLNEKELDMNIDQLYGKLDQLLYPLLLNLNQEGTIHSIANKKEISDRWFKEEKARFTQYYTGDLSGKTIAELDNFFSNIGQYEGQITNSFFYTLFFMPLYVNYNTDNEYTYKKEIPLFPFRKKVEYNIIQRLEKKISSTGKIFIRLNGECTDNRSGVEMERGSAIVRNMFEEIRHEKKGDFKFIYKLNSKDKTLFSGTGEVNVIISPKKKRTVKMEIYELI